MSFRFRRGFLLILFSITPLSAQSEFEILRYTIDGGGGSSSGGGFGLSGTIGQPDAGRMSGGEYELVGGFWGIGSSPPTDTPSPTATQATLTPTPSPTATFEDETPTETPEGTYFDVKPDALDGFIDSRDLIEWVTRMKKTPPEAPDVLFEFSLYWEGEYPPVGKDHDANNE